MKETFDQQTVDNALELLDAVIAGSSEVEAPPITRRQFVADAYGRITVMRRMGYTWDAIAETFGKIGIEFSTATLKQYYREVEPQSEKNKKRIKAKVKRSLKKATGTKKTSRASTKKAIEPTGFEDFPDITGSAKAASTATQTSSNGKYMDTAPFPSPKKVVEAELVE
jgi:hypothetical protein